MPFDPYTKLVSTVLFPAHERLKGHTTTSVRRALERSQWWAKADLEEWRVNRLRRFLGVVGERVPYYQRLFAGWDFQPDRIQSTNDLADLPRLTKEAIRRSEDLLKAEGAQGLVKFNTGGSTGEPLIFYLSRERVSHDVAAKWRATRWWGVDIGDPEIVLWGSPIEVGAQDRIRALRDRLFRTRLLPAFQMSETNVAQFARTIHSTRPKMLFGYPSALAHVAAYARQEGVRLDDLGIRVAFVTGERLYNEQRAIIEQTYGCRVANGYGGRDSGLISHECPSGGMHVTAEDIIVEIVDDNGRPVPEGQIGEIVVTHMATADFPFVRYATGDVGALDDRPCSCGRGLPLFKEIHGRSTDFIVSSDGTVMHGLALIYVVREVPGVSRFKIVQESLRTTRVLLVPGPGFDPDSKDKIRAGIKSRLGEDVDVLVDEVSEIGQEKSGKFRYVVSNVSAAH